MYLNIKNLSGICLLLMVSLNTIAQKLPQEKVFLFDSKMKGVAKPDSATFLVCVAKLADTLWQYETYKLLGPLTSSEQYRDEDATIATGTFTFYHPTGYVDSTGSVLNGRLNGDWSYYNDSGKVIKQKSYAMGRLIKTRDFQQEEKAKNDSIAAGLLAKDDKEATAVKSDERESSYAGGHQAWGKYLNKNFGYPERAINNNIAGKVIVQFIIDTEGKPTGATIFKSVEFSLDKEAKKLILLSNKWLPAYQGGKLVKSYKRQPIIYQLQ